MGYLILRRGVWGGKRLISENWLRRMLTPQPLNPSYGYLWWLNTDRSKYPSAPASCVLALGAGGNTVIVDFDNDLVVVTRWIRETAIDGLLRMILDAVDRP
jgi:CubicO group peptidase (beta-lactamase class C family)